MRVVSSQNYNTSEVCEYPSVVSARVIVHIVTLYIFNILERTTYDVGRPLLDIGYRAPIASDLFYFIYT